MSGAVKSHMALLLSSDRGRDFLLLLAIGAFMAAVGAFDTDGAHPAQRFAYWLGLMAAAGLAHVALETKIANAAFANGVWSKGALLAALMTVALTPVVWLASAGVFGAALSVSRLIELTPGVLVVNAALVALLGVTKHRTPATESTPVSSNVVPEAIRNLLPASMRQATLHALQAEDHYVRVHTNAGAALIRITMRDAVAALDPALGFQTHRSWWVREGAIRDVRWKRGRAMLKLENDIEAPVSRTYAKDLVAAKKL